MKIAHIFTLAAALSTASPALAADVEHLASCTTKVFDEIGRTQKWSGKSPAGCSATIGVRENGKGLLVSASSTSRRGEGWMRTSFTAEESFAEIAGPGERTAANREIMSEAKRLSRCLRLLGSDAFPAECRCRGASEYLAGEESGVVDRQDIHVDGTTRISWIEYVVSDTIETPTPADEPENNQLPPGILLRVLPNGTLAR